MFRRALFTAWILSSVGLVVPPAARACACSKASVGACEGLQKGDVVFLGTVTDIEQLAASDSPLRDSAESIGSSTAENNSNGESRLADASLSSPATTASVVRYRFHIDENFAGPDAADIEVFSGGDDGDCGYRFQQGERYIVFTQQEVEGRLFATICNGTRLAAEGRALIPQLRAMHNGQRVASVFGVLRRADPPFLAPVDDPDDPLPNISLKLRSRDDRFSTATGPGGIYTFYDVNAGQYNFTANLPVRMVLTQKTLTTGLPPFKIPDGACYEYNVDALPTGHIRGAVLGPDGKPLKLASVELYRQGRYSDIHPGLWGFQGSKGYFDFDHIGPGEYLIVYNRMNRVDPNSPFPRSFYPGAANLGEAEPVRLKDGQQLLKANIKLQEGYPTRLLRVRVSWEQGKPPGNLTVMAKAEDGTANPAAQKIAEGLFEFTLLESGHYTISAWEDLNPTRSTAGRNAPACAMPARMDAVSVVVDAADTGTKEVTLTFAAVECAKENGQL